MNAQTAEELDDLLMDYQVNCIRGGFPDLNGTGKAIEQMTLEDENAPPLAKFIAGMGGEKVYSILRYWEFRDAVNRYQVANGISAVRWSEVTWKGETIRFPEICNQLTALPGDIEICARHKDEVVAKFLEFCDRWHLPIYLDSSDEEGEVGRDSSAREIREIQERYRWGDLRGDGEIRPVHDGDAFRRGETKVLYHEAHYSLSLQCGDNSDSDPLPYAYFSAVERFNA